MSERQKSEKRDFTPEEARAFWQDARARASEGDCDFRGVFFPKDPDGQYFRNTQFRGAAIFRAAEFGGDVSFEGAKFAETRVNFSRAKFGGVANFSHAEFGEASNFTGAEFRELASFIGAKFGGEATSFIGAKFGGKAEFTGNAKFGGRVNFYEAKFDGPATFADAKFDRSAQFANAKFGRIAQFAGAKFGEDADFRNVEFGWKSYFEAARFDGDADFSVAKFDGDAEFRGTVFYQKATMEDAVSHGVFTVELPRGWRRSTRRPFARLGQGHDTYRMAKQSATDRGDYQRAGKFHYAEQSTRCMARWLSGWQRLWCPKIPEAVKNRRGRFKARCLQRIRGLGTCVWSLGEMVFARLLFAYGERVRGILAAVALVIFGWSFIYCHSGIVADSTPEGVPILTHSFRDCLYFSVVTFTTLGYGDLQPVESIRAWAATEALLGAFLMALFVVGMARKFTR